MKLKQSIYARQNDKTAIKLLKASYRCLRNERIVKYVMIFLSFAICLVAILNRYLPSMIKDEPNIVAIQETATTYINLISGVILVVGIAMGFYTSRMHTEGTVLQDRYEAYIFDNPPNLAILRPVPQTIINMYSQRVHKKDIAFRDYIYKSGDDPDPDTAQFNYINDEAHSNYRLFISIQPFFITVWISFCVLIVVLAATINAPFIETLINIMIPSLSAITTIGNSWHNYRQQIKQLQNLLAVIDQIQRLPDDVRLEYIRDRRNMRALADGLYNYRISPFVIPNFLVRRHLKSLSGRTVSITIGQKHDIKTEMPSLVLPDLEGDISGVTELIHAQPSDIKTVSFSRTHTVSDIARRGKRYTAKAPAQRPAKPAAAKKEPAKPAAKKK